MKKNAFLFLRLLLILALTNISSFAQGDGATKTGCGTKPNLPKSNSSPIDSKRWNLIEINGEKIESSKASIELNLTEKRFVGNAGCNQMFGEIEINKNEIKFTGIGATKMFCSQEGVMKQETDFLKALGQTTRYAQLGATLEFYAENNLVLKFTSTHAKVSDDANSVNTKLEDKKWILVEIAGKLVPKVEETPFIVFDKTKSSAGGNTGCNSFGGTYKTDGNNISITEIISTQRACVEDERMNIERALLDGLQKANRFEIKAGKLHLYRGDSLLLTFSGEPKS